MDNEELPANYLRIISCLRRAHEQGRLSLSAHEVAHETGLAAPEIAEAQRKMLQAGLLDKLEDDGFSLSALGLRSGRTQADLPKAQSGLVPLLFEFQEQCGRWEETVRESNIGVREKENLVSLGTQLFSHPATFELLRRMILKGR